MKAVFITLAIVLLVLGGRWYANQRLASAPAKEAMKIDVQALPARKDQDQIPESEEVAQQLREMIATRAAKQEEVKKIAESPNAIEKLTKLVASGDIHAACELGETGSPSVVEGVKTALTHSDWKVRNYSLIGIGHAIEDGRASSEFKKALVGPVAAMLRHGYALGDKPPPWDLTSACRDAVYRLCLLDQETAKNVLLEPGILRIDNPNFHHVLGALNNMGVVVGDRVTSLLPELRPKALAQTHPYPNFYGEILRAAALQKHPKFEELIKDALENFTDSQVHEKAAEAVCLSKGLPPTLDGDILDWSERVGFEKLPVPVQYYLALWDWEAECSNGGISQYYYNSAGDRAFIALQGAKAVGATRDAFVIEKTMAMFGPNGPPLDWATRRSMIENNEKLFQALDDADIWPDDLIQKSTKTMIDLYAASHAAEFRGAPRSSR